MTPNLDDLSPQGRDLLRRLKPEILRRNGPADLTIILDVLASLGPTREAGAVLSLLQDVVLDARWHQFFEVVPARLRRGQDLGWTVADGLILQETETLLRLAQNAISPRGLGLLTTILNRFLARRTARLRAENAALKRTLAEMLPLLERARALLADELARRQQDQS